MNDELCKLSEWMAINKLYLNVRKTSKCVSHNGEIIDRVHTFKFLGVIIDDKWRWTDHVLYIKKKLSKGIGIICKAKRVLSSDTLLTLYNCFIYPYIVYCIEVWVAASMKYLMSILRLQKELYELFSLPQWGQNQLKCSIILKYYQYLMFMSLGYQCLLSSMKTIFWLNVLLDSL